jgi:aminopeptidase N
MTQLSMWLVVALAAVSVSTRTPDTARPESSSRSAVSIEDWSYVRLDLDIRIDSTPSALSVVGRARLRLESDSATTLTLGMNSRELAMRFTTVSTRSPGASAQLLPETTTRQRVEVRFDKPQSRGAEVEVLFTYVFVRPSLQLVVRDTLALASWVEAWYPTPLRDGTDMIRRSTTGGTTFDLPATWHSVTNGKLLSTHVRNGRRVDRWQTEQAVNRSFAAAPYKVARTTTKGRDISVYLIRTDSIRARKQAEMLERALTVMEAHWGPYPYPSYAIAEIADSVDWAASSEQGFIMARTAMFGPEGNLPLVAHEAAHGWWGNLVNSAGPGRELVGEALAQYSALLAIEAIEGKAAAADFLQFARDNHNGLQCARGYFFIIKQGGDVPLASIGNGAWDHSLADSKGYWFYHMLRGRVGDQVFFDVLRGLIRDYAGRALTLDALRSRFLSAAGQDTGLKRFFEQWLDRAGAPIITYEWNSTGGWGDSVQLLIRQHGDVYELPLDLEVRMRGGTSVRHRVTLSDSVTRLTFSARFPVGVELDPDRRLLFWRPEYGPRPK